MPAAAKMAATSARGAQACLPVLRTPACPSCANPPAITSAHSRLEVAGAVNVLGGGGRATMEDACLCQNDEIQCKILSLSVVKIRYIKDISHCYFVT